MEYYFFVIIMIVVLKILFWTCYFYVRTQRIRQLQTTRHFIIVGAQPTVRGRTQPYNDRSAIIEHQEPVSVTGPPAYTEVVKDGSAPLPPSYDQVMGASVPPSTQVTMVTAVQGAGSSSLNPNNGVPVYQPPMSTGDRSMPVNSLANHNNASAYPSEYPCQFSAHSVPGTGSGGRMQ